MILTKNSELKALGAKRIISLVPSLTEFLYDIQLENEVVGITKFCVHPDHWYQNKPKIGGTKKVNIEAVRALRPDLIIANKEENTREDVESLATFCTVYVSEISTFNEALTELEHIGQICGREHQSKEITESIHLKFSLLGGSQQPQTALYLIWRKPYMCAGNDTYIHEMMHFAGFENCISEPRYPSLSDQEMHQMNPEFVLLSSEPYPFKPKYIEEMKNYFPSANILWVDGEMFSWYGSRMLRAATYFHNLRKGT